MSNLTISDIARMANVGKATVSRALSGNGYVSNETRQKIEKIIHECGYVPSAVAQDLTRQSTGTVGLIIPQAENPFFAAILDGITEIVDNHGLTLILCNTNDASEKDLRSLQLMKRQRVCGLIFTPAVEYDNSPISEAIKRHINSLNCPVVILDRPIMDFQCDTLLSDNFMGAYTATKILIEAGHKKIATIAGDLNLYIARERLRGFKQALFDAGLPLSDSSIIYGEFDKLKSYQRTKDFLKGSDLPTAVFVSNNMSGHGFFRAVSEIGFHIPNDISYIGFDDVEGANLFGNKYSYMDRGIMEMGRQAAQILIKRMHNPGKPIENILMPLTPKLYGSEKLPETM